jgi:manganese transport protein
MVVDSIEVAHKSLEPLLGALSSGAFGVALLASGFSSSAVGAMAGDTVMYGFVYFKMPINLRRILTMLPGILVIAAGVNPMKALLLSQVSLSFALPAAIIPMLIITGRKKLMGEFVNKTWVKVIGIFIVSVILALNVALLYFTFI